MIKLNILFLTEMSNLLDNLLALFTFLFNCMGSIANFFVTNTLGMVILGCVVFGLLVKAVTHLLKNVR